MYKHLIWCILLNILIGNTVTGLGNFEGDQCFHEKTSTRGMCINIKQCPPAIQELQQRIRPQTCSFDGRVPVVCCPNAYDQKTTVRPNVATTQRPSSTTEYIPPVYDYVNNDPQQQRQKCPPLDLDTTARKTGRKAWDKCIEYQEKLIYPCAKQPSLAADDVFARQSNCKHQTDKLIVGGINAAFGEFPHMALLAFNNNPRRDDWICGGSLISEKFVLTAGHCTYSKDFGNVARILLGAYQRSDNPDPNRIYTVKKIFKHPDYKPPAKYNDIALLESQREMRLDSFAVPACLDINWTEDMKALATGWGTLEQRGDLADTLQKVTLEKFTIEECRKRYQADRKLKKGILNDSQICYGAHNESKDTCQGDSGGPLQVRNKQIKCMYTVIGVTSFGRGCGDIGVPGIYVRVSKYIDWIETIVWP